MKKDKNPRRRKRRKPNPNVVPKLKVRNTRWFSEDELVEFLGMHPNTLYNHRRDGHIGHSKPGAKLFYPEEDVHLFLMRFYKGPTMVLVWLLYSLADVMDVASVCC
jgi:hypothetical protein